VLCHAGVWLGAVALGWIHTFAVGFGCAVGDYPCAEINFGHELIAGSIGGLAILYVVLGFGYLIVLRNRKINSDYRVQIARDRN
jgi:hypothetical protein